MKAPSTLQAKNELEVDLCAFIAALEHDGVLELCVFKGKKPSLVGYFNDAQKAAKALLQHDRRGNCFVTINPCNPALLARGDNKLIEGNYNNPIERTKDNEITLDNWFLIDVDPKRPSGISSTDEELAKAADVTEAVYEYLLSIGVPAESFIKATSGNGYYLLLRLPGHPINEQNKAKKQSLINFLADRFSDDEIEIDRTVFNAARLACAIGTMKVKGENITERPHRRSVVFSIGGQPFDSAKSQRCTPFDLYALAETIIPKAELNAAPKNAAKKKKTSKARVFDIRNFTNVLQGERATQRGITEYTCPACNGHHKLWIEDATGKYGCHHTQNGTCSIEAIREALGQPKNEADSKAKLLIEIAREADLFHNAEGRCFAAVHVNDHREVYAVKSGQFKRWLAGIFWQRFQQSIHPPAIAEALLTIESIATYEGPTVEVHRRIAEQNGNIYLDLCDDQWRQVEITAQGWQVVGNSTVRFTRVNGMLPLPEPQRGGSLAELRACLNLEGDANRQQWVLLASWLIAALRPGAPFPLLALHGEQGSGKSTASRMLRALIDPNSCPLRSAPRDERDLMIAATNAWICAFDNLTSISELLSNALCRLSTGGGFATRELYSDSDEKLFDAMRPLMINGISEVATRSDLIDRAILINLPTIPEAQRRDEKDEVWPEFEGKRPKILGALLDCVSDALGKIKTVKLASKPRMADFAKWSVAAEQAAGFNEGAFMKAYSANRESANRLALDSSVIAPAIVSLIEAQASGEWKGMVGSLLKSLNTQLERGGEDARRKPGWPQTARRFSAMLKEIVPNLRKDGIEVAFGERAAKGYPVSLVKSENKSTSSTQSTSALQTKDLACEHSNVHQRDNVQCTLNVHSNVHSANSFNNNDLSNENVQDARNVHSNTTFTKQGKSTRRVSVRV